MGHAELGQQGQQIVLRSDPTVVEPTRLIGRTL
jgi:hypothetical protein